MVAVLERFLESEYIRARVLFVVTLSRGTKVPRYGTALTLSRYGLRYGPRYDTE